MQAFKAHVRHVVNTADASIESINSIIECVTVIRELVECAMECLTTVDAATAELAHAHLFRLAHALEEITNTVKTVSYGRNKHSVNVPEAVEALLFACSELEKILCLVQFIGFN